MNSAERPPTGLPLFLGLFHLDVEPSGTATVVPVAAPATTVPCPTTGRLLKVATIQGASTAICPRCAVSGRGGFASFVADLRMVYACPACRELVWLAGV